MSTQSFTEADHPRDGSGKFATKPATESDTDLGDDRPTAESGYAQADVYEQRVGQAQRQMAALQAQVDSDSAAQLGCFLRVLTPEATHARLEWDEHRWRLDAALDADGHELAIDHDSQDWWDCEDGIDVATGQISQQVATRPAVSFGFDDGSISDGNTTVVDVRPAQ